MLYKRVKGFINLLLSLILFDNLFVDELKKIIKKVIICVIISFKLTSQRYCS